MSHYPELLKSEFEAFLDEFSQRVSYKNHKLVGLSIKGKTYTVHQKHGDVWKKARSSPDGVGNLPKNTLRNCFFRVSSGFGPKVELVQKTDDPCRGSSVFSFCDG
jgi:hypothetical protein